MKNGKAFFISSHCVRTRVKKRKRGDIIIVEGGSEFNAIALCGICHDSDDYEQ